jgi:DNA-binding FadR family transcriptional regulator
MGHLSTSTIPRTRFNAHQTHESQTQYLEMISQEHESIFQAILHRDPAGARSAMRAHLVSSRERLHRAYDIAIHQKDQLA